MAQVSRAQRVKLWFSSWLWTKTHRNGERENYRKLCPETWVLALFYQNAKVDHTPFWASFSPQNQPGPQEGNNSLPALEEGKVRRAKRWTEMDYCGDQ